MRRTRIGFDRPAGAEVPWCSRAGLALGVDAEAAGTGVIGNVGVTFKGSGFYRTDSRTAKKSTTSAKPAEKKSEAPKSTSTTKTAGAGGGGSSTSS